MTAHTQGRPKSSPEYVQSRKIQFRVTERERALLLAAAARGKQTLSSFCRGLLLDVAESMEAQNER